LESGWRDLRDTARLGWRFAPQSWPEPITQRRAWPLCIGLAGRQLGSGRHTQWRNEQTPRTPKRADRRVCASCRARVSLCSTVHNCRICSLLSMARSVWPKVTRRGWLQGRLSQPGRSRSPCATLARSAPLTGSGSAMWPATR